MASVDLVGQVGRVVLPMPGPLPVVHVEPVPAGDVHENVRPCIVKRRKAWRKYFCETRLVVAMQYWDNIKHQASR